MIRLKRILVPTDFSDHSEVAVRYGCELAAKFGAELHLLHIVELTPLMYGEGAFYTQETAEQMTQDSNQRLEKLPEGSFRESLDITRITRDGHPLPEICGYARENDIDLIVLGTHGRGAIAHMLLGSVAEKVVRKAPCPVMTVHNPEHEFIMP